MEDGTVNVTRFFILFYLIGVEGLFLGSVA